MAHSIPVLGQALQTFCPVVSERVGMKDLQTPQDMKLKEGIRGAVDATVTIRIGETGTMGEMEVGEGVGEGGVVVITEVGKIDRHTETWIAMIESPCLPDDICGVDEADRGVLHREVPDMGMFLEGTNVSGVLPVWTHVSNRRLHSQLL